MSTTQRSESMNAFSDKYINSYTTLKQFVEQYDGALKEKIDKESITDFGSYSSTISLISQFQFEEQFQRVYTDKMVREFQMEVRGMLYCNVSPAVSNKCVSTYKIVDVSKGKDGLARQKAYNVLFNELRFEVLCLCHLFEFKGIICRHILKVMVKNNVFQFTPDYIIDQWRKDIKRNHNFVTNCYDDLETHEEYVRQDSLSLLCS
ncbi:hypothetical protein L1049_008864 [Liquidambar formosana]|uniref:Protein FAR1-RELATED SEQUENCE n=1 Tax=Liquidambar formosana TaxID=63359 RepID=A0AAP0SAB4_LIQFO